MNKGRLEAFSDGVLAIIITIMVLELKVPHGASWADLAPLFPVFLSYLLSFIYIGIYWNNHHHMLHAASKVTGGIMWANLHLLFWLSVVPFATAWMGENHFAATPVALYGVVLFMAGGAYFVLAQTLAIRHGKDSKIAIALGKDFKGMTSMAIYAAAIAVASFYPAISCSLYVIVALMWLIPDRRIEKVLAE
jgi:uncharacterized membrane protein